MDIKIATKDKWGEGQDRAEMSLDEVLWGVVNGTKGDTESMKLGNCFLRLCIFFCAEHDAFLHFLISQIVSSPTAYNLLIILDKSLNFYYHF